MFTHYLMMPGAKRILLSLKSRAWKPQLDFFFTFSAADPKIIVFISGNRKYRSHGREEIVTGKAHLAIDG